MSEEAHLFETQVVETIRRLGFRSGSNRFFKSDWSPDFVGKADDGSTLVVEVKTGRVSIPDVLAVASATSSGSSFGSPASGAIISRSPIPSTIARMAKENDVAILTLGNSVELEPKLEFLTLVSKIEYRLRKWSGLSPMTKVAVVIQSLVQSGRLTREMANIVDRLWEARNALAHEPETIDTIENLIASAKDVLGKLGD